jgi:hypothetical protein
MLVSVGVLVSQPARGDGDDHGSGDLSASERDWRNPVAKITIRRIR